MAILPFLASPAWAATLTVDDDAVECPGAGYSTIQSAVAAATAGDTITVCAGTYLGWTNVNKSLTINGAQAGVDARTRAVALTNESVVDFDGSQVGFTLAASDITIDGFYIRGNTNGNSNTGGSGLYSQGTNDGYEVLNNIFTDHIIGMYFNSGPGDPSVVEQNRLFDNDNPGPSTGTGIYSDQGLNDAVIQDNKFVDNTSAGGSNKSMTLGPNWTGTMADNMISGNEFDGTVNLSNHAGLTVSDNDFVDLPIGATVGSHPGVSLNGGNSTVSVDGNSFSRSGDTAIRVRHQDFGFTPLTNSGVSITGNTIDGWDKGVATDNTCSGCAATAFSGELEVHYNRIVGTNVGVQNTTTGTIDAENNWWGCNGGPLDSANCDPTTGSVDYDPWLVLKVYATPQTFDSATSTPWISTVTADMTDNSNGGDSGGYVPDGTVASFAVVAGGGSVSPPSDPFTSGTAETTWTNPNKTGATVRATVDNESEDTTITETTTSPATPPGTTVSSDPGPDDPPSSSDPVQTGVTTPSSGGPYAVTISEGPSSEGDQQGYDFFDYQVNIDVSPDGTVADPIIIGFSLDSSILPPGTTADNIQLFVDHTAPYDDPVLVPTCSNPALVQAVPDPCVAQRLDGPSADPALDAGDVYIKLYTSAASAWWFGAPNASLPCTITGTNGNDVIFGTGGDDVICALGGNDHVRARGGDDVIYGGDGRDKLYGEAGNDQVWGDAGNDEIFGNGDEDELHGGTGNDDIWGAGADDAMFGEAGNDALHGNDGAETMFGGAGNDEAFGGDGDDYMEGGAGKDLLMGGAGSETALGGDGDDSIFGNVEADLLFGGDGDDEISAGEGDDVVDTGDGSSDDGDNLVHTGDGDDTVTAYGGDDSILTGSGNDTVDAGDGDNEVFTQDDDDTITTGVDDDIIDAGEGDDTIFAGDGDDEVIAGGGDDIIWGDDNSSEAGDGDDVLNAEQGDDFVNAGDGDDEVLGGGGDDTIEGDNWLTFANDGDDVLFAGQGDDTVTDYNGENAIDGNEGDDEITAGTDCTPDATPSAAGAPGPAPLGATFPDNCTSTSTDPQSIDGGGGNDVVATGSGDDHVLTQEGKDEVYTYAGDDAIDGMEGNDELFGGADNDEMLGGGGNDYMEGGTGDDKMFGGAGNDDMFGGDGDDIIYGDTGNDDIDGDDPPQGGAPDYLDMDECFQNEGTGPVENCENV